MNFRMIKGYILVVLSGLLLLTGVLLVVLQWGRVCGFSLFGYPYEIVLVDGKVQGGVNTLLLMVSSAVGGVLFLFLCRVFVSGVRSLRKARRRQVQEQTAKRLSKLEKAHRQTPDSGAAQN